MDAAWRPSSRTSTAPCRGGMDTSNTAKPTCFPRWTATCDEDCGACCNGGEMGGAEAKARPINAGPTNGLPNVGCCPWQRNTNGHEQSYNYEPTDWRAGCGKSARPVRREG